MHLHAEHALFFERRRPLWVATFGVALTACVLIFNAGARSTALSLIGAGIGAVLLLRTETVINDTYDFAVDQARGHRRIKPALVWTSALVALALLGGAVLSIPTRTSSSKPGQRQGLVWGHLDPLARHPGRLGVAATAPASASDSRRASWPASTTRSCTVCSPSASGSSGVTRPASAWGRRACRWPPGGRCSARAPCTPSRASNAPRRTRCCAVPPAKTFRLMAASTSMPSTSNARGSWCSSVSRFAWHGRSGCSCAGQAEPGNRACCACSRGSTGPREGP